MAVATLYFWGRCAFNYTKQSLYKNCMTLLQSIWGWGRGVDSDVARHFSSLIVWCVLICSAVSTLTGDTSNAVSIHNNFSYWCLFGRLYVSRLPLTLTNFLQHSSGNYLRRCIVFSFGTELVKIDRPFPCVFQYRLSYTHTSGLYQGWVYTK